MVQCLIFAGHAKVSVANCNRCHFSTHPKTETTFAKYLQYWQQHNSAQGQSARCQSAQECDIPASDFATLNGDCLLYLKDWHFTQ